MNLKHLKVRIQYFFQFIPFTWNTFFSGILFWFAYKLLHRPLSKENMTDARLPFVRLMGTFVGWLILTLIIVSVVSTLSTWLYYLWLNRKNKTGLQLRFYTESRNNKKQQFLEATLPGVFRPLLGSIKGRIFYDHNQLSDKFGLLSVRKKKNSLFRDAITGRSKLQLPDIKEYEIKGSIIFFEDMLHLIALPAFRQTKGNFYQPPATLTEKAADSAPQKTESMDIRIDQLRKVEGEFLNYKDFESGDDVRRIVWKVFAKNRELVVRIPERLEPYASHLYLYASFYNNLDVVFSGNGYFEEMLNFYKRNIWTVYEELQKKEWQVKYIPDQEFSQNEQLSTQEKDERIISNSLWQTNYSTKSYFPPKKGTVLVISSLTDPKELEQILAESDPSIQIIYVPLSEIFRQYAALNWIRNIFFIPAPDRLSKLKNSWIFSPLRKQLLKNEKKIGALLKS